MGVAESLPIRLGIEIRAGEARFRPIVPPYPNAAFLLAAGLTAAMVIRALARLRR